MQVSVVQFRPWAPSAPFTAEKIYLFSVFPNPDFEGLGIFVRLLFREFGNSASRQPLLVRRTG